MAEQRELQKQIYRCIRINNVKRLKQAIDALDPRDVNFSLDDLHPLAEAAMEGKTEIVKVLLRFGADPNMENPSKMGGTALHWAATYAQNDVIRLLLDAGADINARNNAGYTPLHLCLARHWHDGLRLFDPHCPDAATADAMVYAMVELLLQKGAAAFIAVDGETAFTCACREWDPSVAELFRQYCPSEEFMDAWIDN